MSYGNWADTCGETPPITEVEFVGIVLEQHNIDMARLGAAFTGCVAELLTA